MHDTLSEIPDAIEIQLHPLGKLTNWRRPATAVRFELFNQQGARLISVKCCRPTASGKARGCKQFTIEKKRGCRKKDRRRGAEFLSDCYVRKMLRKSGIPLEVITGDLIAARRAEITRRRLQRKALKMLSLPEKQARHKQQIREWHARNYIPRERPRRPAKNRKPWRNREYEKMIYAAQREEILAKSRQNVADLSDVYVRNLLKLSGLPLEAITPELILLKRAHLGLSRAVRESKRQTQPTKTPV